MAMVPAEQYRAAKKEKGKLLTRTGAALPWSEAPEGKAHGLVFAHVSTLRSGALSTYRDRVLRNLRLYAGSMSVNGTDSSMPGWRIRYNLERSVTDTAAAVMVAAKTLPFAQTRGADWKLRRKAASFNRTVQQQFGDIGVFNESQQVILDALITGLGALKFYEDPQEDGATTGCERCLPLSIVWDPAEAANGRLTQLFEIRLVNKDNLIEQYGFDTLPSGKRRENVDKIDMIRKATGPSMHDRKDFQLTRVGRANQCVVIEAWRLPTSATSNDGKHGIYVSGGELYSEEWHRPRFPFAFLKGWAPNLLGFTGTSLVELVEPAQQRIEELHDFTDACQNLGSVPRVIVDDKSNVEPGQINNLPMQIIKYKNGTNAPIFQTFDATPHDLEGSVAQIREQTLSMLGLSQQQVGGQVDDSVTSAVGQRAREDIQSKRHVLNLRYVEQYYLDAAWCIIDTNNAIADRMPGFTIDREARGEWLEQTKWKEVALGTKDAKLAVFPVSALVGSVSSQYDVTQSWVDRGWCTQETAKLLAGHPDTEGQAEDDTRDTTYSHWLCDKILDGERVTVNPYLDATTFLVVAREAYLAAEQEGAPPEVLAEFRRVLNRTKANVDAANQAAQAASQPPAPPPSVPTGPSVVPDPAMMAAQAA